MKAITSIVAVASLTLVLTDPLQAQKALEEVQQKIEQVQQQLGKQLAKAGQALARAQAAADEPEELTEASEALATLNLDSDENPIVSAVFGGPGRSASQPLIIRSSNTDAKKIADIQEDLNVMSRILNKNVEHSAGHDKHDSAMGIVLSGFPGSGRPQSIYLEGYGAVFMLNVKFPLVPTSTKEEEKSQKPGDTTWEQTKRELYGPRNRAGLFAWQESPAMEYDSGKVEDLKKDILEALKNASNIRDIKPEESIVVAITGGESGSVFKTKRMKKVGPGGHGEGGGVGGTVFGGGPGAGPRANVFAMAGGNEVSRRQTTLTLRAKKSDVDDYAKGGLSLEAFQKKAVIQAY